MNTKLAHIAFRAIARERQEHVPQLARAKNRAQQMYGKDFPNSTGVTNGRRINERELRERLRLTALVEKGWKTVTQYDKKQGSKDAHSGTGLRDDGARSGDGSNH